MTETRIVEYDLPVATIALMKKEFSALIITDKESYELVRQAIGTTRKHRTAIERWRVAANTDDQIRINKRNAKVKETTALLFKIEEPLKAMKKVEDDKATAIEAEKEAKEEERKARIMARITSISDLNSPDIINMGSEEIRKVRDSLIDLEITSGDFEEFMDQAERVKANVLMVIQKAYDERLAFEAAAVKAKEEEGWLAEKKRVQDARDEELAEREAELAKKEAAAKAEEDRIAQEKRKAEIREEARIQAEQNAKAKAYREEKELLEVRAAEAAEKIRQEALKPDKEKLRDFGGKFTHIDPPEVTDKEAKRVLGIFAHKLRDILVELDADIENL